MKERKAMAIESYADEVKIDLGYAGRMVAFSDGVFAVIIAVLVLI
jgi:uncharacterized membrane protein